MTIFHSDRRPAGAPDANDWAATRPVEYVALEATVADPGAIRPLGRPPEALAAAAEDSAVVRLLVAQPAPAGRGSNTPPTVALSTAPAVMHPPALPLPDGFVLNDYRIDGVLGQGHLGITYLATDLRLQVAVAIKEFLPPAIAFRAGDHTVSPSTSRHRERYRQGLQCFLDEARALSAVRHPAIVRVARVFEAQATAYMVQACERGTPLKAWWPAQAANGEAGLLPRLLPLLDGLAQLHAAGILHRDIQPANIQVRASDGSFVLLDFGSAGQAVAAAEDDAVLLSPGYAAPELYGRAGQGPWTDLYALGATLYWAVTGRKPADAELRGTGAQLLQPAMEAGRGPGAGVAGVAVVRHGSVRGHFGEAFLWAVDWALELPATRRPQSVDAWRRALCADPSSEQGATLRRRDVAAAGAARVLPAAALQRAAPPPWFSPADWPLALKLALALLLAALLPLGAAGLYSVRGAHAAVQAAEWRALEQAAHAGAARLALYIEDAGHLASALAGDIDYAAALARPDPLALAAAGDKLVRVAQAHPGVQRIQIVDARGSVLVSSDSAAAGKVAIAEPLLRDALQGRASVGAASPGAAPTAAGVLLVQPIRDDSGVVRGALTLGLRGSALLSLLEALDAPGAVPAPSAPSATWAASAAAGSGLRAFVVPAPAVAASAGAADVNAATLTATGTDERIAYAPIGGQPWRVGVTQAQRASAAPLQALQRRWQWALALAALLALALALVLSRAIVRPLRAMTRALHAVEAGDYDQANAAPQRRDELGQLGRACQLMTDALRERDREQRRH